MKVNVLPGRLTSVWPMANKNYDLTKASNWVTIHVTFCVYAILQKLSDRITIYRHHCWDYCENGCFLAFLVHNSVLFERTRKSDNTFLLVFEILSKDFNSVKRIKKNTLFNWFKLFFNNYFISWVIVYVASQDWT